MAGRLRGLKARMLLLLAFAMAPVGVVSIMVVVATYERAQEAFESQLHAEAMGAVRELRDEIIAMRANLQHLATLAVARPPRGDECATLVAGLRDIEPALLSVGVFGADGSIACTSTEQPAVASLAGSDAFEAMLERRGFVIRRLVVGPETLRDEVMGLYPIYSETGQMVGGTFASISISFLRQRLDANIRNPDVSLAIVDRDGVLVERMDAGNAIPRWLPPPYEIRTLLAPGSDRRKTYNPESHSRFAVADIYDGELFALVRRAQVAWYSGLGTSLLVSMLLPLVMWFVALGIVWLTVERFVLRHVLTLDRIVRLYGEGQPNLRVPHLMGAPNEFNELAQSFNVMAELLERCEHRLHEAAKRQDSLLRELHHRTKNSLQLMLSLLRLRVSITDDEAAHASLNWIRQRAGSLALILQEMQEVEGHERVAIDRLVHRLAGAFMEADDTAREVLTFRISAEPITCDVEQATPIALFITEVISTASAQATVGAAGVTIVIEVRSPVPGEVDVVVDYDRPVQPPPDSAGAQLGRRLIDGYIRQLRAVTLSMDPALSGVHIRFSLPTPPGDRIAPLFEAAR